MNFGPLEFADYLRRKDDGRADEAATVKAARAAAPEPPPLDNRLRVISASRHPTPVSFDGRADGREGSEDSEL